MRIKVTQRNLDDGLVGDSSECPIALAMCDVGFHRPSVGLVSASWLDGDETIVANLPEEAQVFISMYDDEAPVEPFEFELESIRRKLN